MLPVFDGFFLALKSRYHIKDSVCTKGIELTRQKEVSHRETEKSRAHGPTRFCKLDLISFIFSGVSGL
jgi:hypothetical protein